ncbi:LOW QUALITY PROTEIN: hypothetical protein MAR_005789, partial [Mya arenaria]
MTRKIIVNEAFLRNTSFQGQFLSKPTTHGLQNEKMLRLYAVVCDKGLVRLLEVKSPYSARKYTLQESNIKEFCLKWHGDNIVLDETHNHFFQVQGQLLVSGLHFCDFVFYFEYGIFVQGIQTYINIM